MFKKSEESEWTRFSRALGGAQPASSPREDEGQSPEDIDDPVTLSQTAPIEREPEPAAPVAEDDPELPDLTRAVEVNRPEAYEPASAPVAAPSAPMAAPVSRPAAREGDETVIGVGASIDGNVRSEQSIRVAGAVQGEIESKQRIVVEEGARVQARIVAEHVTVLGEVNGAIECSGRVEIAASGRVTGEVSAGTLVIQEGAYFEGHLKMASREDAPVNDTSGT